MDELMLDGNAAGGALEQIFGRDVTTAHGTCAGCGARDAVASVHVFRSAGLVLRCPTCETVLMTIVESASRTWLSLRGLRSFELEA
jgi:hypothetical protein